MKYLALLSVLALAACGGGSVGTGAAPSVIPRTIAAATATPSPTAAPTVSAAPTPACAVPGFDPNAPCVTVVVGAGQTTHVIGTPSPTATPHA